MSLTTIRKAYKFRLKPKKEDKQKLVIFAGHCRFVWNYFWRYNQDKLRNRHKILSFFEMDHWLRNLLKKSEEYGFLGEAHSETLTQKIKDLYKAYRDGFNKKQPGKRMPRFKKKGVSDSFRYPGDFKIDDKRIYLPKIGWMRFYKSQDTIGKMKNCTVSSKAGHWYISVQVEQEVDIEQKDRERENAVGLDMGITKFVTAATLNKHKTYKPKNSFKRHQKLLALQQRRLARKKRFSSNWRKQNGVIQKTHAKIANMRKDYQHKISDELSKNHAEIFVEDLKIANMTKSAKGTIEDPGRNVKAKSGLNRSILDQGWYEFRRQLEYKTKWRGGETILVNPKHTSQRCNKCSYIDKENRKEEKFLCKKCGYIEDADINAARNILTAGLISRAGL